LADESRKEIFQRVEQVLPGSGGGGVTHIRKCKNDKIIKKKEIFLCISFCYF
jgi:hypothetical protein